MNRYQPEETVNRRQQRAIRRQQRATGQQRALENSREPLKTTENHWKTTESRTDNWKPRLRDVLHQVLKIKFFSLTCDNKLIRVIIFQWQENTYMCHYPHAAVIGAGP